MVKLQDLRNPRHIRWPLYFLFAIVTVSFVFFYGWHQSEADRSYGEFGKLRSENKLFKRWIQISKPEMQEAQQHVIREKEMLLPMQLRQIYQQRPQMMEAMMSKLVTQTELAEDAADTILTERAAQKLGVVVTREDIIERLKQTPGLTEEYLDMMAAQMQLKGGKKQLIELERRNNQIERVRAIKSMVAHASLYELWQEYSLANEKLTLRLAAFPNDDYTSRVLVEQADIEKYFNEHKAEFRVPEQRRYKYIKVTRDELSKTIKPTPDQLLAYFNKNQEKYKEPAGFQARELYVPVRRGESIDRVMTIMNDVRTSAAATADWNALADQIRASYGLTAYMRETPWLSETSSDRPQDYMERVSPLANDQVSSPILSVGSDDGATTSVTIAKIVNRREAAVPAYDKVRDQVAKDYIAEETENVMQQRNAQWKAEKLNAKTIEDFAKAVGVEDRVTSMVNAADTFIPGIGSLQQNADYVRHLEENELSDPIPSDSALVVLQPFDTVEAHDQPLDAVRPKVIAALQAAGASKLSRAAAENALKLVQGGAKFEQALADAPVKPVTTEPQTRLQPVQAVGAPLIDFTKQTLQVAKGSVGMTPYGADKDNPIGYVVWEVVDLQPADKAQFAADRKRFEREYLQIQQLTVVDEWLRDQRVQARFEATKTNQ